MDVMLNNIREYFKRSIKGLYILSSQHHDSDESTLQQSLFVGIYRLQGVIDFFNSTCLQTVKIKFNYDTNPWRNFYVHLEKVSTGEILEVLAYNDVQYLTVVNNVVRKTKIYTRKDIVLQCMEDLLRKYCDCWKDHIDEEEYEYEMRPMYSNLPTVKANSSINGNKNMDSLSWVEMNPVL